MANTHEITKEEISFSFGENWKNFLSTVSTEEIEAARQDIIEWLGAESVAGKRIIDIGSGSGIHSMVLQSMKPLELVSIDYDINSVEATSRMWERAGKPGNWTVLHGSILDKELMKHLGQFDIVYSWGVLHHTGSMWEAIKNSINLLADHGLYWISIYQKGPGYERDLKLKRRYNRTSKLGKSLMVCQFVLKLMVRRFLSGKNPFKWNQKAPRGMNVYHDIIDWLGGLPYEVANKEEIIEVAGNFGLKLVKYKELPEGGCSIYLLKK